MPAYQVCQNFFRDTLAPFHKYRQNALLDATLALINGASPTLTSIGRYLPGAAQVKNKIKRVDRLLGNESLHCDIPLIFKGIINMLTQKLSLCVNDVRTNTPLSGTHNVIGHIRRSCGRVKFADPTLKLQASIRLNND